MPSAVTTKGQVTIPKQIRKQLNIQPHDKIDFVLEKDRVVLVPVKTLKDLRGAVKALKKRPPMSEREHAKAALAKRVIQEME